MLADVFIVVPVLPILILMSSLLQGRASLLLISIILIFFNWPWPARQMRSIALSMRERQFVNTARFSGSNTLQILAEEIVPHIFSWAMANFVNTVLVAIATESGLAVTACQPGRGTLGTNDLMACSISTAGPALVVDRSPVVHYRVLIGLS